MVKVSVILTSLSPSISLSLMIDFCVSPLATFEELSSTHDSTYIKRFLEGDQTEKEQRNVGFPWSTEGVDRALSSVGGTLAAACFVCEHERARRSELVAEGAITNSSAALNSNRSSLPAWAAHIAGGTHHAFYDYGEGFSVFSDMAVAANVVLDKYPDVIQNNILMIDLDVHQGNGNAVLFQTPKERASLNQNKKHREEGTYHNNSDRVFTFSMHCSGNYFSQKQDSDLDIELPIGCKDNAYLMTLNHWLNRFKRVHLQADESSREQPSSPKPHRWDLIIFQAGVDVLDDDRLGRMALSQKGVKRRNELVYKFASDLGIPMVICMGGGYPKNDDGWDSIIETHSDVYFGAHEFLSSLSLD